MNKKERLDMISYFIKHYEVGTQEEIVEYLREAGINATQATVSRDIKELGIVKIPLKDNSYIYELPKYAVKSLQLTENNVLDFERQDQMVSLKLIPGSTAFVKRQIVEKFAADIFSILADDDTILLIFRETASAQRILEQIKNW